MGTTDDAMSRIKAETPDLLVSDIGVPQLDGYQLLRNVRAAGFQLHLAKPVKAEALMSAVANLTRKLSQRS